MPKSCDGVAVDELCGGIVWRDAGSRAQSPGFDSRKSLARAPQRLSQDPLVFNFSSPQAR